MPATALGAAARPEVGGSSSVKPQLILIHGGSFLYEDATFRPLTEGPARAAGFTPHYLEYPLGDMPAAFEAARAEARRLRTRFGSAVYAYGSSAGGTLAALLAGEGLVSAAVAKAPISDLLTWSWPLDTYGADYYERIMLSETQRRDLSPLRRAATRPVLVVQGRDDNVVPPAMNGAYAGKFTQVRLWVVPGGHHTERLRPRILRLAFRWLDRLTH
jgi:pimeloyl-ACP methyl ester carboxylesterase